jgi:hypothetical protein
MDRNYRRLTESFTQIEINNRKLSNILKKIRIPIDF